MIRAAALSSLLFIAALGLGCGSSQSCTTDCDCTSTAKQSCPGDLGEGTCSAGTCVFTCRGQCSQLPYTCPSDAPCNGTYCSSHKSCK